jgi:hypothetical protein
VVSEQFVILWLIFLFLYDHHFTHVGGFLVYFCCHAVWIPVSPKLCWLLLRFDVLPVSHEFFVYYDSNHEYFHFDAFESQSNVYGDYPSPFHLAAHFYLHFLLVVTNDKPPSQ